MAIIPKKHTSNGFNPLAKEFRYFLSCADHGNISRAAEKLDVQQAGLSKIIARLEYEIGEKLFYRSPKGLKLSEYGESLYRTLQKTQSYWNQQIHLDQEKVTVIRLGGHPSVAANLYSQIYPVLLKKFPQLELQTEFATSLEVTQRVSKMEIDIGFVINPLKNPDLVIKKVEKQFVSLWAKKISNSGVILYNPQMYLAPRLQKKFKNFNMVALKDYEVIANIVQRSDLMGMLPSPVAERHGLTMVGDRLYSVELGVIWHREKFKNPKQREILDMIFELLGI